jgi:4-amino-4-deoxy-L-arabinose transferase-like glycosyltransferase
VAAAPRLLLQVGAPFFYFPDSTSYLEPALALVNGDSLTTQLKRPIGYPLFLANVFLASGNQLLAVAAVQHVLGLVTVALTYLLGRVCFGRRVGFLAGLMVGLTGPLFTYEHAAITESLFTLLVVALSLALIAAGRARGFTPALYTGALLGAATLVRPVGETLFPPALLFISLRPGRWRHRLLAIGAFSIGCAIVVLPWMLRNQLTNNRFTVGGTAGQSLVARTLNYSHGQFIFAGPHLRPEPDPIRQAARLIVQSSEKSSEARNRIQALGLDESQTERLMRDIAMDAIKHQPLDYVGEVALSLVAIFDQEERTLPVLWNAQRDWDGHPTLGPLVRQPTAAQEAGRDSVERLLWIFRPANFGLALPLFALLGLLLARRPAAPAPALVPGALAACLLVVHVTVNGPVARYRHVVDPLLDVLAVGSVVLLLDRLARVRPVPQANRRVRPGVRVANLLVGMLVPGLAMTMSLLPRLLAFTSVDPNVSGNGFDEGIALEQLYLMAAGFRPFREIYTSQGPLLLDSFYPFFSVFGGSVAAARLPVLLAALVSLATVGLLARRLTNVIGGFTAAVLLGFSPGFFDGSRFILAEVPSIAMSLLSVWFALRYRDDRRLPWLSASAACFALGLLLQPMAAVAVAPVTLAFWPAREGRESGWRRDLARWGVSSLALCSLALLFVPGALQNLLSTASGWTPNQFLPAWLTNSVLIRRELADDAPLVILAGVAIWSLLRAGQVRRSALVLAGSWVVAALLLLLFYTPLAEKQVVLLIAPLALLAGCGAGAALPLDELQHGPRRFVAVLPLSLAVGWYGLTLSSTLRTNFDRAMSEAGSAVARNDLSDAIDLTRTISGPAEYLVTDHPYLAFLAGRRVPPGLADFSRSRIMSNDLTYLDADSQTRTFDAKGVIFWSGRLQLLPGYSSQIASGYNLVAMYDGNRAVYARNDVATPPIGQLDDRDSAARATFDDSLELTGVDQLAIESDHDRRITLRWRSARPIPADAYTTYLELRRPDGRVARQRDDRFLPPWQISAWPAHQSMLQRRWLDLDDLNPGTYTLVVYVTTGPGSAPLPVRIEPDSSFEPAGSPGRVNVARVMVK